MSWHKTTEPKGNTVPSLIQNTYKQITTLTPSSREFCGENEDRSETVKKKEFVHPPEEDKEDFE